MHIVDIPSENNGRSAEEGNIGDELTLTGTCASANQNNENGEPTGSSQEVASFRAVSETSTKAAQKAKLYPSSLKSRRAGGFLSQNLGVILIVIGVAMLGAALFIAAGGILSSQGQLEWHQVAQYEVPDGMLQDGGSTGSDTSLTYLYDVSDGQEPYAVEYHAFVSYDDSLLPTADKDLYEQKTAREDGTTFKQWAAESDVIRGDVTNFRKIDIHLPAEAKQSVDALAAANSDNEGDAIADDNTR